MTIMEKINIAKLLKDYPKGMELDCTVFEDVTFEEVRTCYSYPIKIIVNGDVKYLTEYGCISYNDAAKCVIFPKGKTTWEGFHRPFKDGDIIFHNKIKTICIFKKEGFIKGTVDYYCGLSFNGTFYVKDEKNINEHFGDINYYRFATEEEKQKLFDAIKANDYKWNPETKTLEKFIEPKFKVGDRIKNKYINKNDYAAEYTIRKVYARCYKTDCGTMPFEYQDDWELVSNKFDITTFKPFESKVLVRSSMDSLWKPAIFGFRNGYNDNAFYIVGGSCWKQCIPYLNNEHLCGTTDDCDDYYKTWE